MLELDAAHLWLAVAVLLGFSVQTALGFGGGLLSMALAAQWMPIQAIVPLLVPLSVAQSIAVLATERQHVAWRPLLRLVVPAMSAGLVVGLWLATLLAEHDPLMRRVYGGLVIALALPGVWPRSSAAPRSSAPRRARAAVASVISGIVHGLFATGGPPLAYAGPHGADRSGGDRGPAGSRHGTAAARGHVSAGRVRHAAAHRRVAAGVSAARGRALAQAPLGRGAGSRPSSTARCRM